MTESSYQQNRKRRVVNHACQLASFDRISERATISPRTYVRYANLRLAFVEACPDDNNTKFVPEHIVTEHRELIKTYYRELGIDTARNVVYDRVETVDTLRKRLGELSTGGFRISVSLDTGGLHAVGLMQVDDDTYRVRSTWSPFEDEDAVSTEQLYEYLDLAPRLRKRENSGRKTFKTENIIALPPEPRHLARR